MMRYLDAFQHSNSLAGNCCGNNGAVYYKVSSRKIRRTTFAKNRQSSSSTRVLDEKNALFCN
jgi:hypothetical protein